MNLINLAAAYLPAWVRWAGLIALPLAGFLLSLAGTMLAISLLSRVSDMIVPFCLTVPSCRERCVGNPLNLAILREAHRLHMRIHVG